MAKDINLSALGVPLQEQRDVPDIYSLPMQFNQGADKLWREAVSGLRTKNPRAAWNQAVTRFISLCEKANVFPFQSQSSNNEQIYAALAKARASIVKFMDRHEVYKEFKPRSVTRKVSMLPSGFAIKAEARADVMDQDPKLLKVFGVFDSMGLRKATVSHPTVWEREIESGARFFIANEGARMTQRWSFGYEIWIPMYPSVPGKHTPSNAELESFILETMYAPLVRGIRPLGTMHRLI